MSKKIFKKGYCSKYGHDSEWRHDSSPGDFPPDIIYNDILEECLRKEFDEKLQQETNALKQEIALLKKALADALDALSQK